MMSIKEALTTRDWPASAKLELSVRERQASGLTRHDGERAFQGRIGLPRGALPIVQREAEALGKEGQPGGEEAETCLLLGLKATSVTLYGSLEMLNRAQTTQGARPLGTPVFLGACSFKESLCCFQGI